MSFHFSRFLAAGTLLSGFWFPTTPTFAQQQPSGMTTAGAEVLPGTSELTAITRRSDLEIHLTGPEGKPIGADAKVTLVSTSGQLYRVGTAKAGRVMFEDVPATKWQVLVVASGFVQELVQVDAGAKNATRASIQLRVMTAEDASFSAGLAALPAKAQTELGKVLAAMHANKQAEARSHLEAANKAAPNRPEVNYLFGLYFSQAKDFTQANSYWKKTLEANPKHFLTLLSLGEGFLHENKAAEALPYLERAVEAEPTSWRAHALLANAEMHEGSTTEAIQHAERALELGHGQAEKVQPFLAGALARHGEKDRAIALLQSYVKEHPADAAAQKQLEKMQTASIANGAAGSEETSEGAATMEASSLPEVSNWLPPDIDERVPKVEAGASCQIDEVLRKAGKRVEEFVGNVERFSATEFVTHESINKWGMASSPEQRKFEYLVSVQEVIPGFLKVDEYRSNRNNFPVEFPGGVETNGLPALVLIFHPYNAGNFEMTCEGLTQWNGGLAWQVHFRQRSDKPNRMRAYKLGLQGRSYAVALKGRAWIAADSFQITRIETDLIAPIPQIRLFADHTAIEYGPVHFKNHKVDMWLPQNAEVFYDWRGQRIHRRHSFNNYLLFAVDDKQQIAAPKGAQELPSNRSSEPTNARP